MSEFTSVQFPYSRKNIDHIQGNHLSPSLMRSISSSERFMAGRSVSIALFRSAWAWERRASNDIVLMVGE